MDNPQFSTLFRLSVTAYSCGGRLYVYLETVLSIRCATRTHVGTYFFAKKCIATFIIRPNETRHFGENNASGCLDQQENSRDL